MAMQIENDDSATKLIPKTGDAMIRFGESGATRVQFPFIDNIELSDAIDEWKDSPEIGHAPEFDFFMETADKAYAQTMTDLEPKPLDYDRVVHIFPPSIKQKDNLFLKPNFKKLCSHIARSPFSFGDIKQVKKIYGSIPKSDFETIMMTLEQIKVLVFGAEDDGMVLNFDLP